MKKREDTWEKRLLLLEAIVRNPGKTGWHYMRTHGCIAANNAAADSRWLASRGYISRCLSKGKFLLYPTDVAIAGVTLEELKSTDSRSLQINKRAILESLKQQKSSQKIKELCLNSQGYYSPSMYMPFKKVLNSMVAEGTLHRTSIFPEIYSLKKEEPKVEKELPPPLYQSKPKPKVEPTRDDIALQIAELLMKVPTGLTEEQKQLTKETILLLEGCVYNLRKLIGE